MNICSHCGAPIKDDDKFCKYCGIENGNFHDIDNKYSIKIKTPLSSAKINSVPSEIVTKGYKQLLNYLAAKIKVLRRDDIINFETEYIFYIK